ncbi:MAG: alpha-2-macroglobulin family protein, partial [Bacteroidetes bacterium]|nr:alpha-2-macroglobulin family protein [Bacteroidota bacterium]
MKSYLPLLLLSFGLFLSSCGGKGKISIKNTNFVDEISLNQNLYFEFNQDIVDDSIINIWDSTAYLTFKPEVVGRFMWESPNSLMFAPNNPFKASTDYEVVINKAIKKVSKEAKKISKEAIKFHTPYLGLSSSDSYWALSDDGKRDILLRIGLNFNYDIEPAQLQELLELEIKGEVVDFLILTKEASVKVDIAVKASSFEKNSANSVNLTIKKGLKLKDHDYTTDKSITQTVSIPPKDKLQVLSMNSFFEDGKGSLNVLFSQPIISTDLKQFIKIKPSISYEVEMLPNGFTIKGDFLEGESYIVTISAAIEGVFDKEMGKDYSETINFGSPEPHIEFADQGNIYLSPKGNKNIAVRIISVPKVKLTVYKIFENNILHYLREGKGWDDYYENERWYEYYGYEPNSNYGQEIFSKEINTKSLQRSGNVSLLNIKLDEFDYNNSLKGLYLVKIESADKRWLKDMQMVSVSDIGLMVKEGLDEIFVFANSLKDAKPISGMEVRFISTNNQNVYTATTDNNGVAVLDNLKSKIDGYSIAMITAQQGNDFNFLSMNQCRLEMSRYDVGGKITANLDYDVFVYGDRNLYRPGDSVFINTVVRNMQWQIEKSIPLKVKVILPNGRQYLSFKKEVNLQGASEIAFSLPQASMTGMYSLEVYGGNDVLLNTYRFSVEEFMPDRIRVEAKLDKKEYKPSDNFQVAVKATNLFGPPAANRNVEVELNLSKKYFYPKGYEDYTFNVKTDNTIYFDQTVNETVTDANGEAVVDFDLPTSTGIGVISGKVYTTVFDETGRPVNRISSFDLFTQNTFYGIQNFDYWVSTRKPIKINLIALNKEGQMLKSSEAEVVIKRYYWETVMEKSGRRLYYNSQKREQVVLSKKIQIKGKSSYLNFSPANSGEYEIRVMSSNGQGYVYRKFFAYGWADTEYTSFEVSKEGEISIEKDKESYLKGEKAELLFKSPFEGKLIVTVERAGIMDYYHLDTKNKAAKLTLPLTNEHIPNVYITATALKRIDDRDIFLTIAHGVTNLVVEDKSNLLDVAITAVEKSRSKAKQKITVKTKPGAEVTIAIVDEGILQMTNYHSPNPYEFFYQRRALEVNSYDLYKYLYPEVGQSSSSAGDVSLDLSKRVNPLTNKRVKLLSLWSGQLKANSKGECTFEAWLPKFSGAVRIMAVAYKDNQFGSAEKEMKVADPIVISSALPRILSPGDKLVFPITLTNTTAKSTKAKVTISVNGPIKIDGDITQSIQLNANSEGQLAFQLIADKAIGNAEIKVKVSALNEQFSDETNVPVRPAAGLEKKFGAGNITAGKTVSLTVTSDFLKKSSSSKLILSKSPLAEFSKDLEYLIRYPYGCLEQTVSAAFPQLYIRDLATALNQNKARQNMDIDYNVQQAIHKVQSLQMYDGSFTYWPSGSYANVWASVYATHFLVEAKKAGYEFTESKLNNAMRYLKRIVKNKAYDTWHYYDQSNSLQFKTIAGRENFYALFVLAASGKENRSIMNYYKANLHLLSTDSKFLLAGSFALIGDMKSYQTIVPKA